LQAAEDDIIGITRPAAAEPGLGGKDEARRGERLPHGWQPRLPPGRQRFQRLAESRLPAGAEVGLIPRVQALPNIPRQQADNRRVHHLIRPGIDEPGMRAATRPGEQARALGVGVLEVFRDAPGIGDGPALIDDDGDPFAARECELLFLGVPPRHRLDRQPLVRQRHARAPAIGAEPEGGIGAGQIEQGNGHVGNGPGSVRAMLVCHRLQHGLPSTGSPLLLMRGQTLDFPAESNQCACHDQM